jgi:hypothetical protein
MVRVKEAIAGNPATERRVRTHAASSQPNAIRPKNDRPSFWNTKPTAMDHDPWNMHHHPRDVSMVVLVRGCSWCCQYRYLVEKFLNDIACAPSFNFCFRAEDQAMSKYGMGYRLHIEVGEEIAARKQGVGTRAPEQAQGSAWAGSQQQVWMLTAGKSQVDNVLK